MLIILEIVIKETRKNDFSSNKEKSKKNFPRKPANGGTPPKENKTKANKNAITGKLLTTKPNSNIEFIYLPRILSFINKSKPMKAVKFII